jgi:hypothetical protein
MERLALLEADTYCGLPRLSDLSDNPMNTIAIKVRWGHSWCENVECDEYVRETGLLLLITR